MPSPLFPFPPNWARPVRERLEWLTDVNDSKNETEERLELRTFPRRLLEFDVTIRGTDIQYFDGLLHAWQSRLMIVPTWTDPSYLSAGIAAGATSVAVVTDGLDFRIGGSAVLWASAQQHEVVTVTDVLPTSVTVLATVAAWPAGTRLYPARLGRLVQDLPVTRRTDSVLQSTVPFELQNDEAPAAGSAVTYLGAEVHLLKPNWINGIQNTYVRKTQRLDYDMGVPFVDDLSGRQTTRWAHKYLLGNRSKIDAFRAWLHTRKGRSSGFWQPSWQSDITLTSAVTSGAVSIVVAPLSYTERYAPQDGRQHVMLRNRVTGELSFHQVTGATAGVGSETLALASPVGFTAAPADVTTHWLSFSRLEADGVELAWHTSTVMECAFDIRSIRV